MIAHTQSKKRQRYSCYLKLKPYHNTDILENKPYITKTIEIKRQKKKTTCHNEHVWLNSTSVQIKHVRGFFDDLTHYKGSMADLILHQGTRPTFGVYVM